MGNRTLRFLGVVCGLMLIPASATAMTVQAYKHMTDTQKGKSDSSYPVRMVAEAALIAYRQGIAETLSVQRGGDNRRIQVNPHVSICVPESTRLDEEVVRRAIGQEIYGNAKQYSQIESWEQTSAAHMALLGLAKLFPCTGVEANVKE